MKFLICDPVCIQEHGHNLTAAIRYGSFLNDIISHEKDIRILVGKSLNLKRIKWVSDDMNVEGVFSHYYPDLLPVEGVEKRVNEDHGRKTAEIAYQELLNIIQNYIGDFRGVIYYPSIDYFSLRAIIDFLKNHDNKDLNILFVVRFIGVMEFHKYDCPDSLDDLLLELRELKNANSIDLDLIRLSAESSIFADYIEKKTDIEVTITPTLADSEMLRYPKNDIFTIAFPGSARRDKGFDRISSILDELEQRYTDMQYRVLLQALNGKELEYFSEHLLTLARRRNVVVYPSSLSYQKIKELFLLSDLIVAPYDSKVYKYRSSAIMAESAIYGRSLIMSHDCGFSSEVEKLDLGMLASSNKDFADKIYNFYKIPRSARKDIALNNRYTFSRYTNDSYRALFSSVI